ncbi:unnamed protein product [Moneuplotes crassus]|uniref:Uncharacterized protein n=1 Tax=Euplotes crassus TaxID=5936 RepID=A0AAD1U338_EUPCR|nr:unnamed protein product [Moneuplotes crassus]
MPRKSYDKYGNSILDFTSHLYPNYLPADKGGRYFHNMSFNLQYKNHKMMKNLREDQKEKKPRHLSSRQNDETIQRSFRLPSKLKAGSEYFNDLRLSTGGNEGHSSIILGEGVIGFDQPSAVVTSHLELKNYTKPNLKMYQKKIKQGKAKISTKMFSQRTHSQPKTSTGLRMIKKIPNKWLPENYRLYKSRRNTTTTKNSNKSKAIISNRIRIQSSEEEANVIRPMIKLFTKNLNSNREVVRERIKQRYHKERKTQSSQLSYYQVGFNQRTTTVHSKSKERPNHPNMMLKIFPNEGKTEKIVNLNDISPLQGRSLNNSIFEFPEEVDKKPSIPLKQEISLNKSIMLKILSNRKKSNLDNLKSSLSSRRAEFSVQTKHKPRMVSIDQPKINEPNRKSIPFSTLKINGENKSKCNSTLQSPSQDSNYPLKPQFKQENSILGGSRTGRNKVSSLEVENSIRKQKRNFYIGRNSNHTKIDKEFCKRLADSKY